MPILIQTICIFKLHYFPNFNKNRAKNQLKCTFMFEIAINNF